ncbi:MAG: AAA domain-containing protein [Gammaproteobacteria bacterium]|nr:AAA domain-containing protein [Gammaproteobacteria bacterium]
MEKEIDELIIKLHDSGFIANKSLATTLTLMEHLSRPLLIEGEPGVGKTTIASALSQARDTSLIRIQCFEGIDASSALYEWNYTRQLLSIRLSEQREKQITESDLYSEEYLLERPLLASIRQSVSPVLLIDEIDRADEAFEAFLLEVLSEFTISIPEIGTLKATTIPRVILTSNGTRELSDALRRRCLYHYADYPDHHTELSILKSHLPNVAHLLLEQVTFFVQQMRTWEMIKRPGVAETLDWAKALCGFDITDLRHHSSLFETTLSCLIKTHEDQNIANSDALGKIILPGSPIEAGLREAQVSEPLLEELSSQTDHG